MNERALSLSPSRAPVEERLTHTHTAALAAAHVVHTELGLTLMLLC